MRTLTKEKKDALKAFYMPKSVIGDFLIRFIPLAIGWSVGLIFLPYLMSFAFALLLVLLCIGVRYLIRSVKLKKAMYVYQNGVEGELIYQGVSDNWNVTLNGWPQQVISSFFNGSLIQTKTFNPAILKIYSHKKQVAYAHVKYQGLVVPSGLFSAQYEPSSRKVKLLFNLIFWVVVAIYGSISIYNFVSINKGYLAQTDAVMYRINNTPVFATAANNGSLFDRKFVTVSCLNLNTGKKIWQQDLKAKNENDSYYGEAHLLGMSDKYLFFYHNGLFVLDKNQGDIIAKDQDFPELAGKFPKKMLMDYYQAQLPYIYNDSMHALIISATDGLMYTIDGNTLKTGRIDMEDQDHFFDQKPALPTLYNKQIASMYDDGNHAISLMDNKDAQLVRTADLDSRPDDYSIRRQVYLDETKNRGTQWQKSDSSIYIFGGLLVDYQKSIKWPVTANDSIGYLDLFIRFNHDNPPLITKEGNLIIMHKTSTARHAHILLTAMSILGSHQWQVDTGIEDRLPFYLHDSSSNKLYLLSNEKGDENRLLRTITSIDLQTGQNKKYDIKF
ncbi:hypothetical protein SAMN05192529_11123 [Arachidicoccus rhizosphaerae]|uniref:Uncharacterized protein n=1 Tax=Arachidicoccus rhizosphaerae TaxID=551991 RepID=A0A1H3ZHV2_9BACT|nr:PA2928 family protein [Arachidicoccus rhizosphaerae]SEA22932.1 hypothetical protein SAMN05192529_11123 [Arachidicoccus rhizosphaerae]